VLQGDFRDVKSDLRPGIFNLTTIFVRKSDWPIFLEQAGLTREHAVNLRARLKTFEDDWNAPGMEAYDKLYF